MDIRLIKNIIVMRPGFQLKVTDDRIKTLCYFIRRFKIFPGWLGCVFIVTAAAGTTGGLHRAKGLVDQTPLLVLLNPCLAGALPADFNISFPCNKSFLSGIEWV